MPLNRASVNCPPHGATATATATAGVGGIGVNAAEDAALEAVRTKRQRVGGA